MASIRAGAGLSERPALGSERDPIIVADGSLVIGVAGAAVAASAPTVASVVAGPPGDGSALIWPIMVVLPLPVALAGYSPANEGIIALATEVARASTLKDDGEDKVEFLHAKLVDVGFCYT